jgi:hypothetical protein
MPDDDEEDWSDLIVHGDLKREVTLDSYVEEQLSELSCGNQPEVIADSHQRLLAFVRDIQGRAQAGDTWWEWVKGTEPLMQQGGLAVVRNGKIVWATMTWIS